ncbi:hypothetical protein QJS10_CPA05g00498 [Acorus calamus]|uniref:Spermatogenesis-associated protein 20-like TRX domain-containing protein n=1 Tax=Acorus calamus TaxID=4465 RepID=A0AAV9ERX4_ACOCL|nr:hypothetical protein QJS10_CPA05g00498 [Acorus calamus]
MESNDGSTSTSAEAQTALRKHTNRLASEHSPYLLQHAHNPFEIAVNVLLGWRRGRCHVMEVESFENEEVAKLLNDWFVSIKVVDREERPDVDKVYMTYVQALYGGGGWPLSVFLSPDLKPLMGGTYFPPDDKYGRPGFKTILRKVKDAWETKQEMLQRGGALAIEQLSEALSASSVSRKISDELSKNSSQMCAEQLGGSYDPKFGGFGSAPKFPRPVEIYLMLYHSKKQDMDGRKSEANKSLEMVCFSLQCMARGGVHDHIGGGFHRYSVDECWHVPHFEKMLYDQGQLANAYLDTFSLTKDSFYSSVARDILDYLRRDMIGAEGEIYSAEDADSAEFEGALRKKEGAFYVWTAKEVEDVMGDSAKLFMEHYYVKTSGNCDLSRMSDPHNEFKGQNVLIERKDISTMASKYGMSVDEYCDVLGTCRQKLFNVRSRRPRPHLDDKVIVSWNGLAISSFSRASKILKAEAKGTKYNFPVVGCDDELFLDRSGGGYFNTRGEDPSILFRVKEDHDGAEPSGNSVSAINLAVFESRLKDQCVAVPLMCCAADMLSEPSRKQVVIVGHKSSTEFDDMVIAVHSSYDPNRTVIHIDPTNSEDMEFWNNHNPNIGQMARGSPTGKVVSHVCQNFTCSAPVSDPDALQTLLAQNRLPPSI